jgi:two-component system nitrogen regulation sensor histidine kinase GlnL
MSRRWRGLPDNVVVVFQERSMADKIDRQLTHRAAARSVTGLASMLAHEIKNPLSGIRGAAQLLEMSVGDEDRALTRLIRDETDRIVSLVDRMEIFSDERPVDRSPVNIHSVLDHVKAVAKAGFARNIRFVELYDPSLPAVYANRDQLVQVFLNLVKNAAEAVGDNPDGEIVLTTAYRPGIKLSVAGTREKGLSAARILRSGQRTRRAVRSAAASVSIRSSPPRPTAPDWALRWWPRSSAATAASWNATARARKPPSEF